jgi:Flp pilus assembly pilin Flp
MLAYPYVYLRRLLAPLRDEKGSDLSEYALLLALIAIAVIAAVTGIGSTISAVFQRMALAFCGCG